jgi:hypothetical protein
MSPVRSAYAQMLYEPAKLFEADGVSAVRTVGHALPMRRNDREGCRIHSKTDHELTGISVLLNHR